MTAEQPAPDSVWNDPAAPVPERVADLIGRMTVAEKVGRLSAIWLGLDPSGADVAHLADGVSATLPGVPFLARPRRAVEVTDSAPYGELIDYCSVHPDRVEQVFGTLAYVDVVNHAKRVSVPALFSVGLLDDITPASTVFAAYNHYRGPKDITVYPFGDHECAGTAQFLAQLTFLAGIDH